MKHEYLALLMIIAFVVIAIILRSIWQFKLIGDSGIRSGFRLKSRKTFFIAAVMMGSFAVQGLLALAYSFAYIKPQISFIELSSIIGLFLCLSGLALVSYSQVTMGASWRIGVDPEEKTRLVTSGIYASVRNPIYTGCIIYGIGLICLMPHILSLLAGMLSFFAIRLYVTRIEEPYLINLHGDAYRQYRDRTGAYLPRL